MSITIRHFSHPLLRVQNFSVNPGESWSIYGNNLSGTSVLLQLLTGALRNYSVKELVLPCNPGILSFAKQQEIFERELVNDDSDFLDYPDPGTLVREFVPDWKQHLALFQALDMERCLDTGYRQLSSGQNRKLLLLMELTRTTDCLILENPFDGLDPKSREEITKALKLQMRQGHTLLFFVSTQTDIPSWCSHLALIRDDELVFCGKMPKEKERNSLLQAVSGCDQDYGEFDFPLRKDKEELVFLENGFAGYGGNKLFSGVNLRICDGDHTLVTGCNGCGKSTLFEIITGDNPKCYSNELRIFGKKRGSGESIWEIKKEMGIVSPALHREHRGVGTVLQVVLSGLFDSIGLYTPPTAKEIARAKKWLAWTGLAQTASTAFRNLDYGKQRLILIARALVKEPKLLMLDEPTHGLDDSHRQRLLSFLEKVARQRGATIFYISHRQDEYRSFFRQRIVLEDYLYKIR